MHELTKYWRQLQWNSTRVVGQMSQLITFAFTGQPCSFSGIHPIHPQQTDIPLRPSEDRQRRVLEWLHVQPEGTQLDESTTLDAIFPEGPHPKKDTKLDFVIADNESTFDLIFQFYLVDLVSVRKWSMIQMTCLTATPLRQERSACCRRMADWCVAMIFFTRIALLTLRKRYSTANFSCTSGETFNQLPGIWWGRGTDVYDLPALYWKRQHPERQNQGQCRLIQMQETSFFGRWTYRWTTTILLNSDYKDQV